jgi:hypothetical protein
MRDSLAKTLALLESRQVYLRGPDRVFTAKSCALLASFDRDSCSWKTLQQSLVTDSQPYSQTWPRWGMTADGSAYAHPMSERRITETDGSFWPTPCARDHHPNGMKSGSKVDLGNAVKYWPTPSASDFRNRGNMSMPSIQRRAKIGKQLNLSMVVSPTSGALNPNWTGWLMGFPIAWASSKATETHKSLSKPQQHGDFLGVPE